MAVHTFRLDPGGIVELPLAGESLDQVSAQLPRGAYTTFRTYHGTKALQMTRHLDRLTESAALEGMSRTLDHRRVRQAIVEALQRSGFSESRVRLTLSYDAESSIYISVEQFAAPPASAYQHGVRCSLAQPELTRQNPRAKNTAFIAAASAARAAQPGTHELLLFSSDGAVLEGSSSNFFAILKGTLHTAEQGILAGTMRALILEVAHALLPVSLMPVRLDQLAQLDEAFISSVSRGVLPVVAIEELTIGSGVPGPFTQRIRQAFEQRIEAALEAIAPD